MNNPAPHNTADMPEEDCDDRCDFNWPEDDGYPSWHYRRTCRQCGNVWGSLHCAHDGSQNPCPQCGWILPGRQDAFTTIASAMPENAQLFAHRGTDADIERIFSRWD